MFNTQGKGKKVVEEEQEEMPIVEPDICTICDGDGVKNGRICKACGGSGAVE